jgi:threonine/homoserine/homoserine lactone efflux protein
MTSYLLQGFILGFSAGMLPGPFKFYLLSQTLKNGLRHTLPAVLAPLMTDGPIILLVVVLLAQTPPWFINLLHIGGGGFLLYLAWGAFQSFKTIDSMTDAARESTGQSFLKAVMVNLLNPGPYLFWSMVSGPLLVEGWQQSPGLAAGFLASFYTGFVGIVSALLVLIATAGRAGALVRRILSAVATVALLGLGLHQLWSGIMGI